MRTCGELVDATVTLAKRHLKSGRGDDDRPVALRARLTPGGTGRPWTVERVVLLTPYAAESLADDALRAGSGARLELSLAARTSEDVIARVREQFSRLGERGIEAFAPAPSRSTPASFRSRCSVPTSSSSTTCRLRA